MSHVIISSCTNRKSRAASSWHFDLPIGENSLSKCAYSWATHVSTSRLDGRQVIKVLDLYQGRTFTDAMRVSNSIDSELFVVSAGLGLVSAEDLVIPYDLTLMDRQNPLGKMLAELGATSSQWWTALTGTGLGFGSLSTLVRSKSSAIIMLALPSTYLTMVHEDLMSLSDSELRRIRLLTHPSSQSRLPQRLRSLVLPYDERLQSEQGFAGTRSDFAQRALSHFVLKLKAESLPLADAVEVVSEAMGKLNVVTLPDRKRATDKEIIAHIADHWDRTNGHGNRLLRVLRDELLVSCEQGRFQGLWRQFKRGMDSAGELVA